VAPKRSVEKAQSLQGRQQSDHINVSFAGARRTQFHFRALRRAGPNSLERSNKSILRINCPALDLA
jgi:hypothetical protein